MRLLDLFCGAGGASVGYHRAGFEVWGVDREHHKDYPFPQVVTDATTLPLSFLAMFDVVHASPPCQANTRAKHLRDAQGKTVSEHGVDLLTPVRDLLWAWGGPYVIENVPGADMRPDLILCGSMFGLAVRRHRLFELTYDVWDPPLCDHDTQGRPVGVYGSMNDDIPSGGRTAKTLAEAGSAMGIDWMRWADLKEAIPPAYTEWIGRHVLQAVAV